MLAIERRKLILDRLRNEGQVVVRDLAGRFGVSEETIRRDLEQFEQDGLATRSYGGAILNGDGAAAVGEISPAAGAVGRILAGMTADGEHLFLDPGPMTLAIVRELRSAGKKDLTLLTNAVEVLVECDGYSGWEVISLGGSLQSGKFSLAGPQTVEWIGNYHADKTVISCRAIDRARGVTDDNVMSAQVKRAMLEHAGERIVAACGSAFGQAGFFRVCGLDGIDTIVTDTGPPEEWLTLLDGQGITCLYP